MSMMLNKKESPDNLCELSGLSVFRMKSYQNVRKHLESLVEKAELQMRDIQIVMTGLNGNPQNDQLYQPLLNDLFPQTKIMKYKHLFGENYTASALGLYASAHLMKKQDISVMLVVNCTLNGDCSLVLLKAI